jgi:hypothetical protein
MVPENVRILVAVRKPAEIVNKSTHLCEVNCLKSEFSKPFTSVDIRFGSTSNTATSKLGANAILGESKIQMLKKRLESDLIIYRR